LGSPLTGQILEILIDARNYEIEVAAVPEPATVSLVGLGLLAAAARRRRRATRHGSLTGPAEDCPSPDLSSRRADLAD
jgi:hypothetical protein